MKKLISLILAATLFISLFSFPVAAENGISVYVNGEKLEFDVEPILLNDRTMVPMRKIFETMGAKVEWEDYTNTAHGFKDGKIVSVTVDRPEAYTGEKLVMLDQSPVILNDRTLVPLRFVSESLGAKVDWVDETQTVNITYEAKDTNEETFYFPGQQFDNFGNWQTEGELGLRVGNSGEPIPATKTFTVIKGGTYSVYAKARDFETNAPGSRYYNIGIDGVMQPEKMGTHGKEGYFWQKVCDIELTPGVHEISLIDTGKNYGRCEAVVISNTYKEIPEDIVAWESSMSASNAERYVLPAATYPHWATKSIETPQATYSIENNGYKLNFVKGWGEKGNFVQSEMFIKKDGAWIKAKDLTEQFGFLMMSADKSASTIVRAKGSEIPSHLDGESLRQTLQVNGLTEVAFATDYFKSGIPTWFIPNDMQQISDKEILLTFPERNDTTLTVTVSMDDLCEEPKFTLNATFSKDGAHSFMLFNGNSVPEEQFDSVMAPPHFTRKNVPEGNAIYNEPNLFTPVVSYTKNTENGKITTGVVVDPSSTVQDVAYNETSRFGFMLRDQFGEKRAAICAPLFGTDASNFKAGDTYTFSYRVLTKATDWYEAFKHVSQDIYNVKDIRTNYYSSLNDAIFNTTDYMADIAPEGREDLPYSGWNENAMAYGYSEIPNTESQSNFIEALQRYLFTEDKQLLEERVVPTIAFALSRANFHFTTKPKLPNDLGDPTLVTEPFVGGGSTYLALYEMTQGRMPYLLNAALAKQDSGKLGFVSQKSKIYEITKDEAVMKEIIAEADAVLSEYNAANGELASFIVDTYTPYLTTLLLAYEVTGDRKYLDGAEKVGRGYTTVVSGKGYQNGFADNTYHVDPQATADAHVIWADNKPWWQRGENPTWRVGMPYGQAGPLEDTVSTVDEADVPGWLPATVGLSSEHAFTVSHSNYITMSTWASYMVRLSEYTGDDYFATQARNAIIGRFSNYPGYYIDRYYTDYMKDNYPYDGPEYSIIFGNHITPYLAMLEDFLITSAWARSDKQIDFPKLDPTSYSLFYSSQYGYKPGKMYDVDGLWLWNKRGVINPDSVQIDYVAGRKDGTLAIAFMNEDNKETTSTITLGDQAAGFTGKATVYSADGSKSETQVENGVFTITVPAKGIATVVMNIPTVTEPGYAIDKIYYSTELEKTVAGHTNGKTYAIQLTDDEYYAYVYVTDKNLKSLKVDYTVNGTKNSETITTFPFETIIKVPGKADFSYNLTAVLENGQSVDYGKGTVAPLSKPASKNDLTVQTLPKSLNYVYVAPENAIDWKGQESATFKASGLGREAHIRLVTTRSDYPFEIKETTSFAEVPITVKFTTPDGQIQNLTSTVANAEVNGDRIVLNVKDVAKYNIMYHVENYKAAEITIYPIGSAKVPNLPVGGAAADTEKEDEKVTETEALKEFKDGTYKVDFIGEDEAGLRVAISNNAMGFTPNENDLVNLYVRGTLKTKSGAEVPFSGKIISNDQRGDYFVMQTDVKLEMSTDNLTLAQIEISRTKLQGNTATVTPSDTQKPADTTNTDFMKSFKDCTVKVGTIGSGDGKIRLVVSLSEFDTTLSENCLTGINIEGEITPLKGGKGIPFNTKISGNEMRETSTVIVLPGPDGFDLGKVNDYTVKEVKLSK
ncbi:MAG: copper amine oxidase N-terminal domain-containing protein [Clostridia bacterium]|nr:copper amine oxidase N-terminal domain-containing protein [Clostridia bacterium]